MTLTEDCKKVLEHLETKEGIRNDISMVMRRIKNEIEALKLKL